MSNVSFTEWESVQRLRLNDETLTHILLDYRNFKDKHLVALFVELLKQPDTIHTLWLECNRLTDETGVKIAQLVRSSSSLTRLAIDGNMFTDQTFFAIADALLYNTTLQILGMSGCPRSDQYLIDTAFAATLKMNNQLPLCELKISDHDVEDSRRVKKITSEMPHTSMQNILLYILNAPVKISSVKRENK